MSKPCVILAAGRGSRLTNFQSKPLAKVNKMALLENQLDTWVKAGVVDFVIVVGYRGKDIIHEIQTLPICRKCQISWAFNDDWEKPNGISVLKAEPFLDDAFYLTMADHIFSPEVVQDFVAQTFKEDELVLATDLPGEHNPHVDMNDVTKVKLVDGQIEDIGKALHDYSAFDTGLFWAPTKLLDAIRMSDYHGDGSLTGGVRKFLAGNMARSYDIKQKFWIDVDTPKDWKLASQMAGQAQSTEPVVSAMQS